MFDIELFFVHHKDSTRTDFVILFYTNYNRIIHIDCY